MAAALLLALAMLLANCALTGRPASPSAAEVSAAPSSPPAPAPAPTPPPVTPCPHGSWQGGVCADCGERCTHDWQGGVCVICGERCAHERHDPDTRLCLVCGEKLTHLLKEGSCTRCGWVPPFRDESLPEECFAECPEPGTIETIDFRDAEEPTAGKPPKSKKALVYLPYGYDPEGERRYDLVIALHGAGSDEHGMMDEPHAAVGDGIGFYRIYDWMICEGLCEPFILVSVNVYSLTEEDSVTDYGVGKLAERFPSLVLPYIVEHYGTFAADSSPEAMRAAREHVGLIGLSNGSLYALSAGMAKNLEYFGGYACFSGNYPENAGAVIERLNAPDAGDWPVYCFLAGAGTKDFQQNNTELRFELLADECSGLERGANAFHVDVEGTHNWHSWGVEVYNALLVLFQNRS